MPGNCFLAASAQLLKKKMKTSLKRVACNRSENHVGRIEPYTRHSGIRGVAWGSGASDLGRVGRLVCVVGGLSVAGPDPSQSYYANMRALGETPSGGNPFEQSWV